MSHNAENPSAAAESKTAGAELLALLNVSHGIAAIAEDAHTLTRRDLERLHDLGTKVVKIAAIMLTEADQKRLPL